MIFSFDIETAALRNKDEDWTTGMGVTCAALSWLTEDGQGMRTKTYAAAGDRMTDAEVQAFVADLARAVELRHELFTWNGLSFDFRVLAEQAPDAARLAVCDSHLDGMFHFFCAQGYPVGVDAVCRGLGVRGKLEGVSGKDAPELWRRDRAKALAYVAQDAVAQLTICREGMRRRGISWVTKKGATRSWNLPEELWLPVPEAAALPAPDVSWMDRPMSRDGFLAWTRQNDASKSRAARQNDASQGVDAVPPDVF